MTGTSDPWIVCPRPRPEARLRLICLPYAGAGASLFAPWARALPPAVEAVLVQPPGRENRLREAPCVRLADYVEALAAALQPYLRPPFAVFGHSLGALAAFELARRLRARPAPAPALLLASGRRAPHLPDPHAPLSHLPDAALAAAVQRRYQGIPAVIWQDPSALEVFLPALRADLTMAETYAYAEAPPFDFPIIACGGEADPHVSRGDLEAWQAHTRAGCRVRLFPGGHFFLNTARAALLAALQDDLAAWLA